MQTFGYKPHFVYFCKYIINKKDTQRCTLVQNYNFNNMKIKNQSSILLLFFSLLCFTSCNDDEPKFSSSQIQQALFDMKGTYHGTIQVAYYHGDNITELTNAVAVSRDSLSFTMSLLPMAESITDESAARLLREIGEITVTAGYDFSQMDESTINFGLRPKDVIVPGGYGAPPTVRIVFAQNFGGDAEIGQNFMMFNVSPTELWLNDKKYEDFKQLVYHFSGHYE